MGNLKDELAKCFPKKRNPAKTERRQKVVDAGPARSQAADDAEKAWTVGVEPLKENKRASRASANPAPTRSAQAAHKPSGIRHATNRKAGKAKTPPTPADMNVCLDDLGSVYRPSATRRPDAPARSNAPASKPVGRSPSFDVHVRATLAREAEFKKPDKWVKDGWALQPSGAGSGRALSVRVGIDFGTAYTKLALRVADTVLFVPWGGVRKSSGGNFLFLPGEITALKDGSTWLGRASNARAVFGNLKLPFIAAEWPHEEQLKAPVAFLAWIMRYARAWLYQHHSPLLRGRTLAWEVNIGSPTNSWSSPGISEQYLRIGRAAWWLSQAEKIELDAAGAALRAGYQSDGEVGLDGLHLMPEFVAQIAGYVKSAQRRDGLHLLLDVGAGTLDIAAFNVYQPKQYEDLFPIFASAVEPLGTHFLMAERLASLGVPEQNWDDLQAIPSAETFARQVGVDLARVLEVDREFARRVTEAIRKVLFHTKTRRYPGAPEWREGLRVFLVGGGARCQVYEQALNDAFQAVKSPCVLTQLPVAENSSKEMTPDMFQRLSVAYGLTFDAPSIGKILSPHDVEDVETAPRTQAERPDRDELYPK